MIFSKDFSSKTDTDFCTDGIVDKSEPNVTELGPSVHVVGYLLSEGLIRERVVDKPYTEANTISQPFLVCLKSDLWS